MIFMVKKDDLRANSPEMLSARHLVEEHIRIYGMVPHPDKIKEAMARALRVEREWAEEAIRKCADRDVLSWSAAKEIIAAIRGDQP